MIYVASLISGVINGLFASGAGQILVFIFIYILNIETHKARATSIFAISIVTIFTFIRYAFVTDIKTKDIIIVIASGIIFGFLGTKLMAKIKSNYLNLISGIIMLILAMYSLIR